MLAFEIQLRNFKSFVKVDVWLTHFHLDNIHVYFLIFFNSIVKLRFVAAYKFIVVRLFNI